VQGSHCESVTEVSVGPWTLCAVVGCNRAAVESVWPEVGWKLRRGGRCVRGCEETLKTDTESDLLQLVCLMHKCQKSQKIRLEGISGDPVRRPQERGGSSLYLNLA